MSNMNTWHIAIEDKEIVILGHAQWIMLHIGEIRLGVLSLHVPNWVSEKVAFSDHIADTITEHQCVGEEFNMIEVPSTH